MALFINFAIKPAKAKYDVVKDIITLKTQTVNLLNKVLKVDTTKLVDFHVPEIHCDGLINRVLSPEELVALYKSDPGLYAKLAMCGYTRTVGMLHVFALWSSASKSKDLKSFKYLVDCVNNLKWEDPAMFVDFHTANSMLGKCII
jgi:hypothetical protein